MFRQFKEAIGQRKIIHNNSTRKVQDYCHSIIVNDDKENFIYKYRQESIKHTKEWHFIPPRETLEICRMLINASDSKDILNIRVHTGLAHYFFLSILDVDGTVESVDANLELLHETEEEMLDIMPDFNGHSITTVQCPTTFLEVRHTEGKKYDFIFINDNPKNYALYYDLGIKLLRPGGFIVLTNILQSGKVAETRNTNETITSIRRLNESIKNDQRCDNIILNFNDGLHIIYKKKES
uniref:O-methyltransferase n=1 Tax=Parastrongyloides trichosuri TaxID=131310 RepID=A0A0N4ZJ86_PARTI